MNREEKGQTGDRLVAHVLACMRVIPVKVVSERQLIVAGPRLRLLR